MSWKVMLVTAAVSLSILEPVAAQNKPLKIGWLTSYTGPGAIAGTATDAAISIFFKKFGKSVAGREIQIIKRDTTGPAPDVARRLAQELIVNEKVDFLAGMDYTPNTLAVAPLTTRSKTPLVIVNSATSGILEKYPYLVRFGFTTTSVAKELAAYAAKKGRRSVYTVVQDFDPGLDAEAMFARQFRAEGGTIAGADRLPLKATDFSAYIQRIKDAKPDAVFLFMAAGELAPLFIKQFKNAGLDPATILGTGDITYEPTLKVAGDAALGIVTAFHYTPTHASDKNREFVKIHDMIAPERELNFVTVTAYDALTAIVKVVEAQNGELNPDRSMELLRHLSFESPRGPISIDPATRDIVQTIYFRTVQDNNGQIANVEFASVPNVRDPGSAR